ncbi:hypothetical protein HanXRQr2_Chr04g0158871 [Helianthus annuus]|uniref:Uncharacterized protein n=1 Tax=Helianthus annuus TaxID=4232 RepID=A0A9K3NRU0_HELAN|nr:hypothetical protein HanXRQr2_Chr04g0158871 [Helianthus annuus]
MGTLELSGGVKLEDPNKRTLLISIFCKKKKRKKKDTYHSFNNKTHYITNFRKKNCKNRISNLSLDKKEIHPDLVLLLLHKRYYMFS